MKRRDFLETYRMELDEALRKLMTLRRNAEVSGLSGAFTDHIRAAESCLDSAILDLAKELAPRKRARRTDGRQQELKVANAG
jgi:hypothetical protein